MPSTFKPSFLLLFCLFGTAMFPGCSGKKGILSEEEFAKVFADTLRHRFKDASFSIGQDGAISGKKDSIEMKVYTTNSYKEYLVEPDSIQKVFDKYITSTAEGFNPKKISLQDVVPVIKPIDFFDDFSEMGLKTDKPVSFVFEKYNDQLIIAYAQNNDKGLAFLTGDDLKELNVSMDSLKKVAILNFDKALPEIKTQQDGSGLYGVIAGGNFEATLLLMPYMWNNKNSFNVKGDFIIGIPNRDILLVAGSEDAASITKMKEIIAKSYTGGDHQVSPDLFKWNGQKFIKYQ